MAENPVESVMAIVSVAPTRSSSMTFGEAFRPQAIIKGMTPALEFVEIPQC
jgi:hypothetical protein